MVNQWLVENFETEPFDFRVFVRKGTLDDLGNIVLEVYTDRFIPFTFKYKEEKLPNKVDGIHYSVLINKLKDISKYVLHDKVLEVKLMDLDPQSYKKNNTSNELE